MNLLLLKYPFHVNPDAFHAKNNPFMSASSFQNQRLALFQARNIGERVCIWKFHRASFYNNFFLWFLYVKRTFYLGRTRVGYFLQVQAYKFCPTFAFCFRTLRGFMMQPGVMGAPFIVSEL